MAQALWSMNRYATIPQDLILNIYMTKCKFCSKRGILSSHMQNYAPLNKSIISSTSLQL